MTVYLVGAGPGDPGLLTQRGAALLARAQVVVYDRLAHPSLLSLAPRDAEFVDVGKAPGDVAMTQDGINAVLVDRGTQGLEVVRLKGGDPLIFGRGGEIAASASGASVGADTGRMEVPRLARKARPLGRAARAGSRTGRTSSSPGPRGSRGAACRRPSFSRVHGAPFGGYDEKVLVLARGRRRRR